MFYFLPPVCPSIGQSHTSLKRLLETHSANWKAMHLDSTSRLLVYSLESLKPSFEFTDDSGLKIQLQRFPLAGPSHASSELQDVEKILPSPVLSYQRSRSALFWGANRSIACSQDTTTHTAAALRLYSVHSPWTACDGERTELHEYIFIIHHLSFLSSIIVSKYLPGFSLFPQRFGLIRGTKTNGKYFVVYRQ